MRNKKANESCLDVFLVFMGYQPGKTHGLKQTGWDKV